MAMHGRTSWRRSQEAVAVVLLLAAASAATGKQQETTSKVVDGSAAVASRIAAAALAPSSRVNLTAVCSSTPYPGACRMALSSYTSRSAKDPFAASVQFAMARAASARALARNLSASLSACRGALPPSGMDDCAELLDISHVQLDDALAAGSAHDATTWLSAALTNQGICGDSLGTMPATTGLEGVRRRVGALAEFIGTALALHAQLKAGSETSPPSAAPTQSTSAPNRTFSPWISDHDRKLLETPEGSGMTPDAVVALDGSARDARDHRRGDRCGDGGNATGGLVQGECRSREEGDLREEAGRYEESVRISSKQRDVMLMGDGKGKTVIVGHRSAADGYTTYASATVERGMGGQYR